MSSRITYAMIHDSSLRNLMRNGEKLSTLQEQMSSGIRLNRPSDAPIDAANAMELRTGIAAMSQYSSNVSDGTSYAAVLDSALSSVDDLFQRVRELGVQGASDTYSAEERSYTNDELRQLLDELVAISNTSYKGDYIFSGKNTDQVAYAIANGTDSIDTVDNSATDPTDTVFALNTPIQLWDRSVTDSNTASGNAAVSRVIPGTFSIQGLTEGTDYSVDYAGGTVTFLSADASTAAAAGTLDMSYSWIRRSEADLSGTIQREVEGGVTMKINVTADEAFGRASESNDAFQAIISLMQGLHTNTQTEIESGIGNVDQAFDRILAQQSTTGARMNRMDSTATRLESQTIESTRQQSNLEDVDFAEAMSEFSVQYTLYNASLQATAKSLQLSLMDYI